MSANARDCEDQLRISYEILGLRPGVSKEEVKAAYRDLAKVWHPDRFPNDERLQRRGQERLGEINRAYEIISESGFKAPQPRPDSQTPTGTSEMGRTAPRHSARHSSDYSRANDIPPAAPTRVVHNAGMAVAILCGLALGTALAYRFVPSAATMRSESPPAIQVPENPLLSDAPERRSNRTSKLQNNKYGGPEQVWVDFSSSTHVVTRTPSETAPQIVNAAGMANSEIFESGTYVLEIFRRLDEGFSTPSDTPSIESRLGVANRVVETFANSSNGRTLPVFTEAARSALISYSAAGTARPDQLGKWLAAARRSVNDARSDLDYYKTNGRELQPELSRSARAWKKVHKNASRIWQRGE